ncbi:MAG: ACT domain-containing protein [Deltaproteobacteria bacterium]|nr:ACT domain-containing protein [Deltaproteobacteria bacterium]
MTPIPFTLLKETFNIHRLPPDAAVPKGVLESPFFAVVRTREELSIVVPAAVKLAGTEREAGWAGIRVLGPLDFGLTGILAGMAGALAEEGISIFAVSTFDTDYILFKEAVTARAIEALTAAGYQYIDN